MSEIIEKVWGAVLFAFGWLSQTPRVIDLGFAAIVAIVFWWLPSPGSEKRDLEMSVKAAEIALTKQRENSEPNRPITPTEMDMIMRAAHLSGEAAIGAILRLRKQRARGPGGAGQGEEGLR